MEETYQLALKVEEKQNRQFVQRNRGARRGKLSPSWGSFNYGWGKSYQGAEKVKDSQQNNPNPPWGIGFQRAIGCDVGRGRPIVCFKCGVEGHRAFEFPNYNMRERKQGEQPRLNLDQVEDEEEGDEYEVFPDIGENLMIQREMMIPKKEQKQNSDNEDSWLQTKSFRSKCTLGGKVCKFIVDIGNCENMVSQGMVDKLKLHCDKHPHPYRIAWFKKGNEVTVNNRLSMVWCHSDGYMSFVVRETMEIW